MILDYRATNYIGWPLPALYYATKILKILELSKYLCKNLFIIFAKNTLLFTRPSYTFSMAFQQVLRGLVTTYISWQIIIHIGVFSFVPHAAI